MLTSLRWILLGASLLISLGNVGYASPTVLFHHSFDQAILTIGDVSVSTDVLPEAKEVIFNVTLKSGKTRMAAFFKTENGVEYGAYFAYVKRLTSA